MDARWLAWLRSHGLAAFAYFRLKQDGLLGMIDPELQRGLRDAYYGAVGDAELHRAELVEVLGALAGVGVSAVLFKGAVLAHLAYPDPACRPMGDLDLWVPKESMTRARAALEAAGYRQYQKDTRPPEFQAQNGGEIQLVGKTPGTGLVELHYSTFAGEWVRRTTAIEDDCVACRTVPVMVVGRSSWALGPEDALLQLALHLAVNHQMGCAALRSLLDMVLQARSQPPDWMILAQRAREWRVGTATWLVLDLANRLLVLPDAAPSAEQLRPGRLRRGLLNRFTNTESVLMGKDITHGPMRFVYQLLLVDRTGDALRLLVRTLWPEPHWLRLRYGRQGIGVRLHHMAGALRGQP